MIFDKVMSIKSRKQLEPFSLIHLAACKLNGCTCNEFKQLLKLPKEKGCDRCLRLMLSKTTNKMGYSLTLSLLGSLSLENIIDADIAAAVPLISMGALLGRTTPIQLLCMSIFEVALFAANEYLALNVFSVSTLISRKLLCISIETLPIDLRLRWFHYGARLWRLFWPGCGTHAASCCRQERCWQA